MKGRYNMKVIIADDEKWVRAAIIRTIPFEKLGLSLVCEASNGLEALELCKKHQPDILITDIKMPGLTGLELIKELTGLSSKVKIVIISGYSDFEYAKAAMNYGITDYILKPVDQKEISEVLLKLKESILIERKQYEENNLFKSQYEKTISVLRDKFLNQLILPNYLTLEFIKVELKKYNLSFINPYFSMMVFLPDKTAVDNKQISCSAFIIKIMRKYLKAVTFKNSSKGGEIISIINHPNDKVNPDMLQKAVKLCGALYERHFNGRLSVGVSTAAQQITKLPDLYIQCCEALQLKFWRNNEEVFFYQPNQRCDTLSLTLQADILEDMVVSIKISDTKPAIAYIDSLYSQLKANCKAKQELVKDFFLSFVQSLQNRLEMQQSFIEYELSAGSGVHPSERIKNTDSLEELVGTVKEILVHICESYTRRNPLTEENIIENAKKFIDDNFDKNISLEQVSRYVHLNPTYFCELFKRNTGVNFVDYKTHLRIENAKKLLKAGNLNIDTISSRLGYSDSKYFSKLFKRITGKTPQDYKKET